MYIIFIIFIMTFFTLDDSTSYSVPALYFIVWTLIMAAGILHLILLTCAVYSDAKEKKLSSKRMWTILAFLLDIPAAVIYAIFTFKSAKNTNKKTNIKNIVLCVLSVLLLLIFTFGIQRADAHFSKYYVEHFDNSFVTFKNENNEDVIYDKMGIAYTLSEAENMTYYDRDGNSYRGIFYDDEIHSYSSYKCVEDGKEYPYNDYDFLIDKDGYIVILSNDSDIYYCNMGVYYDDEKNIYYYIEDCYWTPDGELVFNEYYEDLDKITYEQILNFNETEKKEEAVLTVERFFSNINDSDWDLIEYCCDSDFIERYIDDKQFLGFKSAEILKTVDVGYVDSNKNKYFVTVLIIGNPGIATKTLTFTLDYDTDNNWYITDVKPEDKK